MHCSVVVDLMAVVTTQNQGNSREETTPKMSDAKDSTCGSYKTLLTEAPMKEHRLWNLLSFIGKNCYEYYETRTATTPTQHHRQWLLRYNNGRG